jgi:hypothetical protein
MLNIALSDGSISCFAKEAASTAKQSDILLNAA